MLTSLGLCEIKNSQLQLWFRISGEPAVYLNNFHLWIHLLVKYTGAVQPNLNPSDCFLLTISSCSWKSSLSMTLISGLSFSFSFLPSFAGRINLSLMWARSICMVSFSCLITSRACWTRKRAFTHLLKTQHPDPNLKPFPQLQSHLQVLVTATLLQGGCYHDLSTDYQEKAEFVLFLITLNN